MPDNWIHIHSMSIDGYIEKGRKRERKETSSPKSAQPFRCDQRKISIMTHWRDMLICAWGWESGIGGSANLMYRGRRKGHFYPFTSITLAVTWYVTCGCYLLRAEMIWPVAVICCCDPICDLWLLFVSSWDVTCGCYFLLWPVTHIVTCGCDRF